MPITARRNGRPKSKPRSFPSATSPAGPRISAGAGPAPAPAAGDRSPPPRVSRQTTRRSRRPGRAFAGEKDDLRPAIAGALRLRRADLSGRTFPETVDEIEATGAFKPTGPDDHRTLSQRYADWHKAFIIPKDKLAHVFDLAIKECRDRTRAHLQLPAGESFTVEYVTGKPWGAYNWYKGELPQRHSGEHRPAELHRPRDRPRGARRLPRPPRLQRPARGKPTRERGWQEFSVYPLYSPQSLIAEGTANFGREVVLTKAERQKFEKEVLWPAAGLDPAEADQYYKVQDLMTKLSYAGNEAARQLIDGKTDPAGAAAWLEKYELQDPDRAKKRVQFIQHYGSYVINYNYGEDLVRQYIEKQGGTADQPEKRWDGIREIALLAPAPERFALKSEQSPVSLPFAARFRQTPPFAALCFPFADTAFPFRDKARPFGLCIPTRRLLPVSGENPPLLQHSLPLSRQTLPFGICDKPVLDLLPFNAGPRLQQNRRPFSPLPNPLAAEKPGRTLLSVLCYC